MGMLRALARLCALAALTGWAVATILCSRLFARLAPKRMDQLERRTTRCWARGISRAFGMTVSTDGSPPRGRYILISNHLSYMDVLALMSVVDARFLSRADVVDWPLVGPVVRFAGTLFVDRTRRGDLPRVLSEIDAVLAGGRGVVFFPEGTSSPGFRVLPFKPSLFEAAARGGFEVACASLHYRTPPNATPAEWSVCWWGDMDFAPHIFALLKIPRYEVRVRFSDQRFSHSDRKQLATAAREEVLRLFEPVCNADPTLP
ncbi:MAG TPA: 1-acyl-sn-glycerol-3-phosphate acyltransferase [Planctomycetes bacterium]|nr:1-acyl-sn-glycerol-3-phosphate acyltransferase [Planctomycetota bacterium]HIL53185.1 1-acyl-sn-glycerol-3-phosphate acyltransferase [Planctomycetota bacterium]